MYSYAVNRSRWAKMSIFEQMGNIGSEVGRSISAWHSGKKGERFDNAVCRALDLFDATIETLIDKKSPKVREVLIAREQFLNLFFGSSPKGDDKNIEKYFNQFAVAARLRNG